jgi:hypothetical protein
MLLKLEVFNLFKKEFSVVFLVFVVTFIMPSLSNGSTYTSFSGYHE